MSPGGSEDGRKGRQNCLQLRTTVNTDLRFPKCDSPDQQHQLHWKSAKQQIWGAPHSRPLNQKLSGVDPNNKTSR